MPRRQASWPDLLYYGEAIGVVLAWGIGVLTVLQGGESKTPVGESQTYATASPADSDGAVN